jgi:Pyruvate/2-oxoacid:ferredoxin oxidoreductase delta subunit
VISDGIPVVNYAKCTACGICGQKCPTKVMQTVGPGA